MSRQNSGFVTINLILFLKKSFKCQQALFKKSTDQGESWNVNYFKKLVRAFVPLNSNQTTELKTEKTN